MSSAVIFSIGSQCRRSSIEMPPRWRARSTSLSNVPALSFIFCRPGVISGIGRPEGNLDKLVPELGTTIVEALAKQLDAHVEALMTPLCS